LENMKQREIATIYGISSSTVEKQVMRATLHLYLKFGSGSALNGQTKKKATMCSGSRSRRHDPRYRPT
jgi:transposase